MNPETQERRMVKRNSRKTGRKKKRRTAVYVLTGVLLSAASLFGFVALWGLTTWGDLDLDEIIFQLQAPLQGTGNGMILDCILKGVLPAVLLSLAYIILMWRVKYSRIRTAIAICAAVLSFAGIALLGGHIWNRLHVAEWLEGRKDQSTFIQENYVDPATVSLTFPGGKKNLIYIYLESMETTYAGAEDGGAFPDDLIPELTMIARQNEDFSGIDDTLNGGLVYAGTTFTTGAMFAQSAGLPLKIAIGGNNIDPQDSFFPGIAAIGDLLEDAGYRQILMIGSDATFGGRRLLYQDHGNFEIMDYPYAKEQDWIPKDYKVFWGYEDEKLFSFAKKQVQELAQGDDPFNFTMLTVDTHFEDGYVCRLCDDRFGDNQYANVIACSSRQVYDFVEWVTQQDFYENTAIVLAGDHTTMDKNFLAELDRNYQRKTYTAFLNAAAEPEAPSKRREYSTLDMFPTTLAAIGASIEGERLGLGTNLFSARPTLTEEYGADSVRQELARRSAFLERLEHTEDNTDSLLERYRDDMKNALLIDSEDEKNRTVSIRVKNSFSSGLDIAYFEAGYTEAGTDLERTVRLMPDPANKNEYIGTLDLSEWRSPVGEVQIDVHLKTGQIYENIVSKSIGVDPEGR